MARILKHYAWPTVAIIATLLGAFAGGVWGASQYAAGQEAHTRAIADHENRLRVVEERGAGMAADIRWIRDYLEGKPHVGK